VPETAIPLAQKAAQLFAERGIENARLEAELLLAHVLGIKRLDLYLQFDRPLTNAQLEQFRGMCRRRLKREPLQYIVGTQQFRHIVVKVDSRALIPRPETELLVEEVVRWAAVRRSGGQAVGRLRALDIGTGTGAIALSLLHEIPDIDVVATDISPEAAALATENGLQDVRIGDLFEPVANEKFDIIVSNPPYVGANEQLQPEVKDWEPHTALFSGESGLDVIKRLTAQSPDRLTAYGLIAIEIGMQQGNEVAALLEGTTSFEQIKVVRDYSDRERIVTAIRKQDA
jgi:release factor glutamine methyltransferase